MRLLKLNANSLIELVDSAIIGIDFVLCLSLGFNFTTIFLLNSGYLENEI